MRKMCQILIHCPRVDTKGVEKHHLWSDGSLCCDTGDVYFCKIVRAGLFELKTVKGMAYNEKSVPSDERLLITGLGYIIYT